jgi:hypothetical protein
MANQYLRQAPSGGAATHTMPDGTVMPGATHAEYQAMQMQNGGAVPAISPELQERINRFAGDPGITTTLPGISEQERIAAQRMGEGISATGPFGEPLPLDANSGMSVQQLKEALAGQQTAPVDPAQELQQRLEQMPKMREGGDVDAQALQNMAMAQEQMANQNVDLETAISGLMAQKQTAEDPDEIAAADQLLAKTEITAQAPLAEMSAEIAAQGRGGDTLLAHLTQGETILPMAMMDDPKFEKAVENRFRELDLEPEEYVAGVGIASLNPMTGLEEFGFFKKLAKGIKKLAKKIAPIAGPLANFIPGVGPILAGAIGAATNVVAGKGLRGAIAGGLGGYGAGKALAGIGSLGGTSAQAFKALGPSGKFSALRTGIGSLPGTGFFGKASEFIMPGQDQVGLFGNIGKVFGGQQPPTAQNEAGRLQQEAMVANQTGDLARGWELEQQAQALMSQQPQDGGGGFFERPTYDPDTRQMTGGGIGGRIGEFILPGQDDRGLLANLGLGGGSQQPRSGGFMGGGLGSLAMAGVPAYMLGKMAFDEAKKDKGVPLTPLTTMGPTGRYNIEAEIARRMGTQTPNPVEFGLLPQGTFPELSGGRPMAAAGGGAVYPMRYANGGDVAMEDFERMNGGINGPGTETSDDVPAMLSDGEFVFTGEAVRGAGGYDMNNQGGILTLTPSGTPDRERGTNLMYEMMDLFGSYANV